jgi:hypothetical protein
MQLENSRIIFQGSSCLLMQPCLTEKLGKSPAVFLQQLHYWLTSKKEIGVIANNKRWIYNTSSDWAKQLYLSARQVRRIIQKLEELGLILINKLSKKKTDRTNWYTIDYDAVKKLFPRLSWIGQTHSKLAPDLPCEAIPLMDKASSSLGQNVLMYIEADTTSEIKPKELRAEAAVRIETEQVASSCLKNDLAKKLLDIWNREVGSKTTEAGMTKQRAKYLVAAYKMKFGSCLDKWKTYCQAIASSEFLIKTFHQKHKLSLEWVLKFNNLQRILEGQFGVNPVILSNAQETIISKDLLIAESADSSEIKITSKLIDALGAETYKSWFYDNKPQIKKMEEGTLAFFFNNKFVIDHVRTRFSDIMENVLGAKVTIVHSEMKVVV